jgi:hypothetical protein
MSTIQVLLETRQHRVVQKPTISFADGHGQTWDEALSPDCFVDWVTDTAFLRPRCFETSWYTSGTTPYDKLGLSDFSGLSDASWFEHDPSGVGAAKFVSAKAAVAQTGITTASWGPNQGFSVSFYPYGDGGDYLALQCGWNDSGSPSAGVRVDVYAGGKIEVFKDDVFVNDGTVGGSTKQGQIVELVLFPCRKRELLILANGEGGMTTPFADLDEDDLSPEIVAAGKFWFLVPTGTPDVQIAPLKFPTSGTLIGLPSKFKRPPIADTLNSPAVWYDGPPSSLALGNCLRSDGVTAFVADGVVDDCRVKVDLSGDGFTSPSVYGAAAVFPYGIKYTAGLDVDVTDKTVEIELRVPDDPAGVEASLVLKMPGAIEERGVEGLRAVGNRPAKLFVGDCLLMNARTDQAEWESHFTDAGQRFKVPLRDAWKVLERTIFDDPFPLDQMEFSEALAFVLWYCGFDDTFLDLDTTDVPLTKAHGSDWNLIIAAGDSAADWIKRLFETYAATWFYGFKPYPDGVRFFAKAPETLRDVVVADLFPTIEGAYDYLVGLGYSSEDALDLAPRRVYRSPYREKILEPEANEVYVTGEDPRDGRPIVRFLRDEDSINPETSPALRPQNWYGEVLTVGLYDPALASDSAVEKALTVFGPRVTRNRRLPTWESEFILWNWDGVDVPAWRGDCVRLREALGEGRHQLVQISGFDGGFPFEAGLRRKFEYCGEEFGEG